MKLLLTVFSGLIFGIGSYAQSASDVQPRNVHAGLLNTKFRLLEQPVYCRLFEVLSSREIAADERNSNGLIVTCWSSDNKESVDEYRKLIAMLPDLEKSRILLIGVSFDNCKDTWLRTIETEKLQNRWNCLYDPQTLATAGKDSTLIKHAAETSLPFTISVRNGIIVGASGSVRFDEGTKESNQTESRH